MSEFLERMFRECGRDVKFTDVTIDPPTCSHCKQVVREGELSRPYSGVLVHELEEFNRRHGVGGYIHRNCSEPKDTGNG